MEMWEGGSSLVEPGLPLYLQGQQPQCFGSQVVNSDPSFDISDEFAVRFEKKQMKSKMFRLFVDMRRWEAFTDFYLLLSNTGTCKEFNLQIPRAEKVQPHKYEWVLATL